MLIARWHIDTEPTPSSSSSTTTVCGASVNVDVGLQPAGEIPVRVLLTKVMNLITHPKWINPSSHEVHAHDRFCSSNQWRCRSSKTLTQTTVAIRWLMEGREWCYFGSRVTTSVRRTLISMNCILLALFFLVWAPHTHHGTPWPNSNLKFTLDP